MFPPKREAQPGEEMIGSGGAQNSSWGEKRRGKSSHNAENVWK